MAGRYSLSRTTELRRASPLKSIGARWPKGCQGGVINALILGISTLILNTAIACWLSAAESFNGNLVVLQRRSCSSSRRIIIAVHLIINILATLLMAASNYCMQILSSPLREEVDAAHLAKKWMYIGVPNLKNLRHKPWTRRLLFLTLAISSLPVHLLWNSAIILELPTNNYVLAPVSEEFVSGAAIDAEPYLKSTAPAVPYQERLESIKHNSTNLTVAQCIMTYSKPFISDYSNLALVTNAHNDSNSLLGLWHYQIIGSGYLSANWPCDIPESYYGVGCNSAKLATSNATNWNPFPDEDSISSVPVNNVPINSRVSYCLAQRTHRKCHIGLTPIIVWIILAANLIKVLCFYGTLILVRNTSKPLITTGDAVQSFLSKPDSKLSQRCLSSISQVKRDPKFWAASEMPLQWLPKHQVSLCGASLSSWLSLFVPAVIGIALVICLYDIYDLNSFLSLGFSSTNRSELVSFNTLNLGIVAGTLLANTPQIILSYIYTAYNAVITSILSHSELLQYSTKRRGLRVTQPTCMQRSSYYLSLPYRFSIPLIVVSAILHWLVSEAFFLIRVITYASDGTEDRGQLISTVGFSAYTIVVSLAVMVFMLLATLAFGLGMRYSDTMPLVATCSASIAAICQPAQGAEFELNLAKMTLSWGCVDQEFAIGYDRYGRRVRHATFSSGRVTPLVRGASYQ